MFFIAYLIACSTCFRNHYAHHQELESIIQLVAASGVWCFGFQVVGMVLHLVGILFPHINDGARSKSLQMVQTVEKLYVDTA
jgi:hypothetical protein